MSVEIGEVIRPLGDEKFCVIISEINKDRIAKCIWNDGVIGTVYVGNITSYGKLFENIELRRINNDWR